MKLRIKLLATAIGCFFFGAIWSQTQTLIQQIEQVTTLTSNEIQSFAPHFPIRLTENDQIKKAIQEWYQKYPDEYHAFIQNQKYQENSFSWYPFGIEVEREQVNQYLNDDLLEWIDLNHFTAEEIKAVAPHFPELPQISNRREAAIEFNKRKIQWLNDYHDEFAKILGLAYENYGTTAPSTPDFHSYKPGVEKPIWTGEGGDIRLIYEMKLQHWYYMHDQEMYRKLYGEPPALPEKYKSMDDYIKQNTKIGN